METFEPKPTYEEQLAWLDLVGMMAQPSDKEMIKAIKENVIAVRNYEKALDNELRFSFIRDRDQAFNDLLAYGEAKMMTLDELVKLIDAGSGTPGDYERIKAYADGEQDVKRFKEALGFIEQQNPEVPFVFRADELNPREELVIDNRLKQLQGELRFELSRKKQFRSQQAIDHCHKSISNLKKWKRL